MSRLPYTTDRIAPGPDGEFDLDALLVESIQRVEETKRLRTQKDRAQRAANPNERASALVEVRAIEDKREWNKVAVVALFREQQCITCSTSQQHFIGYFIHSQHHSNHGTKLVKSTDRSEWGGLPRALKIDSELVDACHRCINSIFHPTTTIGE